MIVMKRGFDVLRCQVWVLFNNCVDRISILMKSAHGPNGNSRPSYNPSIVADASVSCDAPDFVRRSLAQAAISSSIL